MTRVHSRPLACLAALALALAAGCGDGTDPGGGGGGEAYDGPDFWVDLEESDEAEVEAGVGTSVFPLIRAAPGEQAPTVTVRAEGLPEGVYAEPIIVARGAVRGTLWLMAEDNAPNVRDVPVRIIAETFDHGVRETTLYVSVVGGSVVEPGPGCDPNFGIIDGLATAVVGDGPSLRELKVLGDGTIMALGGLAGGGGFVARFGSNGSPDYDFGTAGVRAFGDFVPEASVVGPDGLIYLAGYAPDFGGPVLARLVEGPGNESGLDIRFPWVRLSGGSGSVRALAAFGPVIAASVAVPEGHLLVRYDLSGANVYPPANEGPAPVAARFAADGSLVAVNASSVFRFDADGAWDTEFGASGRLSMGDAQLAAVLPVDTGGILVGGERLTDGDAIVRRVLDGSIDPGFSEVDWRLRDNEAEVVDLVGLRDGAAAIAYESPSRSFEVMLFDRNGGVRENYGNEGPIPLPFVAHSRDARLAVDRAGAILAAGVATPDAVAVCRIPR